MERKTKHRVIGIVVVIGVVIVSLPLFQGSGQESGATLIEAPVFPDQSIQVEASQPDETSPTTTTIQPSPIPMHDPSADTGINQLPDDTIAPNAVPAIPPAQAPAMPQPDNGLPLPHPEDPTAEKPTDDSGVPAGKTSPQVDASDVLAPSLEQAVSIAEKTEEVVIVPPPVKKTAEAKKSVTKMHVATKTRKSGATDTNGLIKLKQPSWAVQLGSFKDKENALRLVNKLRVKGYHAFMQQDETRTRVLVGPENKQQIAQMMASQLEEEMHISGIVVSYKPLAL